MVKAESAYRFQLEVEEGKQVAEGVNHFLGPGRSGGTFRATEFKTTRESGWRSCAKIAMI